MDNPAVYRHCVFPVHVSQVSALYQLVLFRKSVLPLHGSAELGALPGIPAHGKKPVVHSDGIVGRRVLKGEAVRSRHIGKPACVCQHILPAYNQVHMELV